MLIRRHRHRWVARQANTLSHGQYARTRILYVCADCGHNKVRERKGHWSLEDLVVVTDKDFEKLLEPKQ